MPLLLDDMKEFIDVWFICLGHFFVAFDNELIVDNIINWCHWILRILKAELILRVVLQSASVLLAMTWTLNVMWLLAVNQNLLIKLAWVGKSFEVCTVDVLKIRAIRHLDSTLSEGAVIGARTLHATILWILLVFLFRCFTDGSWRRWGYIGAFTRWWLSWSDLRLMSGWAFTIGWWQSDRAALSYLWL